MSRSMPLAESLRGRAYTGGQGAGALIGQEEAGVSSRFAKI